MINTGVDGQLIVALDIGTSKVTAIVGEILPDGQISIKGVGNSLSHGMKKGIVVNIDSTVQSIRQAINEAELMADCTIESVFVGISGSHIDSFNSHGIAPIANGEVSKLDVRNVLGSARAVKIPSDQTILEVLPQEFTIDSQDGIREPIGMSGVRIEADVHMVTCSSSAHQNIIKCIERCNLSVDAVILSARAASTAVLSKDERELGVCLVDIGAGTTDIAVYIGGAIRHSAVLPIAGAQVTNDIAHALRTPTSHAEELKNRYGCALRQLASAEDTIEVPSVGNRPARTMSRHTLAEVIEPRYEELFTLAQAELRRSGLEEMVAAGGIVLTGGTAKMDGEIELAESVFNKPVRLAIPDGIIGLDDVVREPGYATGVGLLLCGRDRLLSQQEEANDKNTGPGLFGRLQTIIRGYF